MSDKTHRELSRKNWIPNENDKNTAKSIKLGAILRIADATEQMAKNHLKLQRDYDYMKGSRDRYRDNYEHECKRSAAFKGHITRLKKEIETLKS